MQHCGFFEKAGPFTLAEIAQSCGATLLDEGQASLSIDDVRPLLTAEQSHLSFLSNRRYADQLAVTSAGACIISPRDAQKVPSRIAILTTADPYTAFAKILRLYYSDALTSKAGASVDHSSGSKAGRRAKIDKQAIIEDGAIIGPEAVVGAGTTVAAGAIVGYRVVIGEDCYIGAGSVVTHALVGNNVTIHAGARIGQDGFGFAPGADGHLKVPQIGAVIIGDNVEIGANTTIDRGTLSDTVIGEGSKIDNLVQIAHNVIIGRHCIIVAQSGIAGSAELGDFVVMGAQSGVLGHVKIGDGAQIAGMAHVKNDVEPGARMGGTPARPFKEWAREVAALRLLGRRTI